MGKYFKSFLIPFIVVGILTVVAISMRVASGSTAVRDNSSTDLTTNVFDEAGSMTDVQIQLLDSYITEVEEQIKCDIAVVIIDESLEDYAKKYESQIGVQPPEKWVMVYADNFAEEHEMGYDRAYGNSIVFVDNHHREESTGKVYSWISTSGLAQQKISQIDTEMLMDVALMYLSDDSTQDEYYSAYRKVVELLPDYMGTKSAIPVPVVLVVALLVAIIYIVLNIKTKPGKRTTAGATYVAGGHPQMREVRDVFITKQVHKTKRESSSSSSGSGGHVSAGGHSHGGGGHSR